MPRYYNSGNEPLIPEGRWGEGVTMPGEAYETDTELGPPWTLDDEADAALTQPDEVTDSGPLVGHAETNQEAS